MKHLPVFCLTLLGMIGSAWSTEFCSEIDGTWEGDANATMQYVCTGHNSCALTRVISGVTPRGLGLATAMTSAAFFPHLEQRIRSASSYTDLGPASSSISRRRAVANDSSAHVPQVPGF